MTRHINTFFAILFIASLSACSDKIITDFEVPAIQDQQVLNNNHLDQFVDDVKPYDDAKSSFYNDNSVPKDQQ